MTRQRTINKMLAPVRFQGQVYTTYGKRVKIPLYAVLVALCVLTVGTNWLIPFVLAWKEHLTVWWSE